MDGVRVVLLLVTTALMSLAEVQAQPARAQPDGARRGYLAVRVTGDGTYDVIDAGNAEGLFVPASVLKLVTVSAALNHLGPDYQWLTRVVAEGRLEAGILDGDFALIQRTDVAREGQIVVALIDDNEATLKYFRRDGARVRLDPANPAYEPQGYDPRQVRIQGKLAGLLRRYN